MSNLSNFSCDNHTFFDPVPLKLITCSIGTSIAAIGFTCNLLILHTFQRNPKIHNSNTVYLQALAIFDIGVLLTYVGLYGVIELANIVESIQLNHIWASSSPYMYPFSRLCQMSTTYLVVAVSMQRVSLQVTDSKGSRRTSVVKILCCLAFAFLSHMSRFYEIEIQEEKRCGKVLKWVSASEIQKNKWYQMIYNLWYTNLTNVFMPFIILVTMCVRSIRRFRRAVAHKKSNILTGNVSPEAFSVHQTRLRDMSRVLIVLIVMYLLLNTLTVILGMIEFIDRSILDGQKNSYDLAVCIINISAVFNSSYRIVTYLAFNHGFRKALLRGCRRRNRLERSESYSSNTSNKSLEKETFL